jgi:hypothetical protein
MACVMDWVGWHRGGFEEIAFDALDNDAMTSVGVGRLGRAAAVPLPEGPLFTFGAR